MLIEIDVHLYNSLMGALALTLFISSYYLTTRLLFKKVEYFLEFFIPLLFLIMFFSVNFSMFLTDLIFGLKMKMITLSEAEIMRHIVGYSMSISALGFGFAVVLNKD
jgi:hypothetical protein